MCSLQKPSVFWLSLVTLAFGLICLFLVNVHAQSRPDQPSALEKLGGQLFSSPILSKNETRSCASCHVPAMGFSGDAPVARSLNGQQQRRRAPSLYGVTTAKLLMWDGRAPDLEHQILLPLDGPELQVDWRLALQRLTLEPEVVHLAYEAGMPLDRQTVLASIVAYVRFIDRNVSRFDRFLNGATFALSEQEQRGFRIFQRKARCSSCHLVDSRSAPFTDGNFHITGAGLGAGAPVDKGRAEVTGDLSDNGAFKTPSLRGAALRPFFLHNGRMCSLREVIEYYNSIDPKTVPGIDPRLAPLHLTASEIDDLVAFIGSLTPVNNPPL